MSRLGLLNFLLAVAVCFGQGGATTSNKDPWIGVWKLDATKSKFGAFEPHRDQVLRFQAKGESLQYDIYTVYASGKIGSGSYIVPIDGKEHSSPGAELKATLTREGSDTLLVVGRRGDKVVQNYKLVVSPDRQTITMISETDRRVFVRRPDNSFPDVAK